MTTSSLPDNLTDRLALIIQRTSGHLRERFIAIRDATGAQRTAMYAALKADALGDSALQDAHQWLKMLRPFLAPGLHMSLPKSQKT